MFPHMYALLPLSCGWSGLLSTLETSSGFEVVSLLCISPRLVAELGFAGSE